MNWLEEVNQLSNSFLVDDRNKALELFATKTKMQQKIGSCNECMWVSKDEKECNNINIKNCNVFTNSLFVDVNSDLQFLLQNCYNYIKNQNDSDWKKQLISVLSKCCFD